MSASSPRRKQPRPCEKGDARRDDEQRRAPRASKSKAALKSKTAAGLDAVRAKSRPTSSTAVDEWVARVLEEKPVGYIIQNLERAYGVPENKWTGWDVLDMLVSVILSQATSDANSDRTYDALKARFPTWDAALRARESTIAGAIRLGGLANQKAAVIRALLRQIKERRGSLDLSFLRELPAEEAAQYLSGFRGVGPKTVACTLLFACGKDIFPLDTHIFRILRRVGLIPAKCSDEFAHRVMNRVVPAGKFYSFHVNLIRHGRKLCRPRDPSCERCPIVEYCDYGRERI
jgi:endonuclease III